MDVKKLIQAAEWCAKNDDCENCPATDECPFIGNGALQVIAIRDHVKAEVIAQVREWVNEPHKFFVVDDLDRIVTDRINSKLDELAVEERLETDTDDPIREIVKLAGETFNGR